MTLPHCLILASALACRAAAAPLALSRGAGGAAHLAREGDESVALPPPGFVFSRNATADGGRWLPEGWSTSIKGLTDHINMNVLFVPIAIGFALIVLIISSMIAAGHIRIGRKSEDAAPGMDEAPSPMSSLSSSQVPPTLHNWSIMGIVALTSYRFYTGFLSSTWMPYLLAMEGHQLMNHRQSFFMGSAKLIYGMSIMMNPMFGLVGDQMAVVSHWSGRRLFVLVGVGASGLGIYGCMVAAQIHSVAWYMAATVLWMLGEAMADVTTETLVPELLPRSQYEISGGIRALNFLLGGLAGYGALIVFRHFHYSWLYYGYLVVMLVCAFLTLCFIDADDLNVRRPKTSNKDISLYSLVKKAYYAPSQLQGGFPTACCCLFVFSLGSAPMFFLLLMVRDVIGIKEHVTLQMHFSMISIAFFVAAAVASVLGVAAAKGDSSSTEGSRPEGHAAGPEAGAGSTPVQEEEQVAATRAGMVSRWRLMVGSTVLFGAVAAVIPMVGLLPTLFSRKVVFYVVAAFFGLSFGSVYARFQECTWSLLPRGVDVANAMGYAAMCKLAGVGIGNFFAGILLGLFSVSDGKDAVSYTLLGYILMCFFCAAVVLAAAYLAHGVSKIALNEFDRGAHRVD